ANAAPWDNLKFSWANIYEDEKGNRFEPTEEQRKDIEFMQKCKWVDGHSEGIEEVQRKLFGTLYNTYGFYALYANVDGFVQDEKDTVPVKERDELDRWILSK